MIVSMEVSCEGWAAPGVSEPILTSNHRADMLAERQERPALRRRAARFERVEALFAAYEPDAHGHRADVLVEPLAQRHLDACVALAVQREGGDPAAWRTALEGGIDASDRASFVGLVDGQLVGYSTVAWLAPGIGHPNSVAPDGWYLLGLVVDPDFRRLGVGRRLTAERLRWLRGRTDRVWYFASNANRASIDLHTDFGFSLSAENVDLPGVSFTGTGLLFGAVLATDDADAARRDRVRAIEDQRRRK